MLLSVIIPVFNEEEIVAETYRVLEEELKNIEHELIFVNDGSKDKTREIVESLLPQNPNNKIINFSRNFGHQAAFSAGLDHCIGDTAQNFWTDTHGEMVIYLILSTYAELMEE